MCAVRDAFAHDTKLDFHPEGSWATETSHKRCQLQHRRGNIDAHDIFWSNMGAFHDEFDYSDELDTK